MYVAGKEKEGEKKKNKQQQQQQQQRVKKKILEKKKDFEKFPPRKMSPRRLSARVKNRNCDERGGKKTTANCQTSKN